MTAGRAVVHRGAVRGESLKSMLFEPEDGKTAANSKDAFVKAFVHQLSTNQKREEVYSHSQADTWKPVER